MIGRKIQHYEIVAKIGEGGMGVVYKAHDSKLDRFVALKFLPPHLVADEAAKQRFIAEAKAASALEHPHICTVYDIGEAEDGQLYMAMPCYEGESLRERIARGDVAVLEALDIAIQLSGALSAAHDKGIVHRDVKPGNVMITPDGQVRLMDFGLARREDSTRMTKTGTTLGTVAYMSPEQAEGRDVDARSDVWSAGAVLYEMLTGQAPFRGDAEPAIVNSILTTEPEPVTSIRREVPLGIEDVVDRALAKDAGKRYQTATELGEALSEQSDLLKAGVRTGGSIAWKRFRRNRRAVAGVFVMAVVALAVIAALVLYQPGAEPECLAVLPLDIIGGATSQDTLKADGMAFGLIATFSKLGNLVLINSKSSKRYRGTGKSYQQIGAELGADLLLVGSMHLMGDDVKISAEVVEASTGRVVWSDVFDEDMSNVFRLQSRMARLVAGAMALELSPEAHARLAAARKVDPEAWDEYQRGMHWLERSDSNCVAHFEMAIELDPDYAAAYAGLAEYYIQLGHDETNAKSLGERAKVYALRSLEIDPDLPEGHAAMGHILWEYDFDMVGAQTAFDRAFEINPSLMYGMIPYGFFLLSLNRHDESAEVALKVARLDPVSPWAQGYSLHLLGRAGRIDEAIAQIDKTVELFPEYKANAHFMVADAYMLAGRPELALAIYDTIPPARLTSPQAATYAGCCFVSGQEARAIAIFDSLDSLTGEKALSTRRLGGLWAMVGDSTRAAGYLREAESEDLYPAFYLGLIFAYADIGDFDKSFELIEWMYDERNSWLTRLRFAEAPMPEPSPLVKDPRYQEWIDKLNLNMYD